MIQAIYDELSRSNVLLDATLHTTHHLLPNVCWHCTLHGVIITCMYAPKYIESINLTLTLLIEMVN